MHICGQCALGGPNYAKCHPGSFFSVKIVNLTSRSFVSNICKLSFPINPSKNCKMMSSCCQTSLLSGKDAATQPSDMLQAEICNICSDNNFNLCYLGPENVLLNS